MEVAQEDINRRVNEVRDLLSSAGRYGDRQDERYCGGSWQLQKPAEMEGPKERAGKKSERPAPPL